MKKIPLILDLDTGIDDAVALVFAEKLKNLNLQLITTVHGNVDIDKVVKNTLIIAEDVNSNVKIVRGEAKSISEQDFHVSAHGKNGLGDYFHETRKKISKQNYLNAIHQVIKSNEFTNIVCCGPLTNLANYILKFPEDNDKVRVILVTGLLDIDETNPYLNFNITKDVKAFELVLNTFKNIVFVPSDMGHNSYIDKKDFCKSAKCGKVGTILANMYPHHLDRTVKNGAALHDLCGVLWLSNPNLFKTKSCNAVLKSYKDVKYLWFDFESEVHNCKVAYSIDVKKMHKLYYKTLRKIK